MAEPGFVVWSSLHVGSWAWTGSGPGIGVSDRIGYYCFSFVGLWACDFGSLIGLVDNTSLLLGLGLGWNWGSLMVARF